MSLEIFSNNGSTVVVSGGTDAPSAGTSQTWEVMSSDAFPAADGSANPPTQFHVVDPDDVSEIILVTDVSSTTWTVIRGVEGTTPFSHEDGFSVVNVVTADWATSVEDRLAAQTFTIPFYIPDPTVEVKAPVWIAPFDCTITVYKSRLDSGSDVTVRAVKNGTAKTTSSSVGTTVMSDTVSIIVAEDDCIQLEVVSNDGSGAGLAVTMSGVIR